MSHDHLSRRELLGYSATFGSAFLAAQGLLSEEAEGQEAASQGCRAAGRQKVRHEEVDQPVGAAVSAEDDAEGVPATLQGRGL